MSLLIGLDDFTPYKAISANTNEAKKLTPYIQEAQEFDLKALMGAAFYLDFVKKINDTNYQTLLNGKEYLIGNLTVKFDGIKPLLCYLTYARYVLNSNIEDTPSGLVQKTNNYSTPISEKTIARKADQARAGAFHYQEGLLNFLVYNKADYPIWNAVISPIDPFCQAGLPGLVGGKLKRTRRITPIG